MSWPAGVTAGPRVGRVLAVLLLGPLLLAACPDEDPDTTERSIEIYGVVLDWVIENRVPPPPDEEEVTPVFVESLGPEVDLQVQVELLDRFEGSGVDLRFIDARTEAVADDVEDQPVQAGGILVGVGPIPDGRTSVDVRAEIYRTVDDVEAHRFPLVRRAEGWQLLEEPTEVDPEGLVPTP